MKLFDTFIGRLFGRIRPGSSYRAFPWRSWDRICTILETCAGYGIIINRTPTGSDWSIEIDPTVTAKIQPFTVVAYNKNPDDENSPSKIMCYLPPGETEEAVRVNGFVVPVAQGVVVGTADEPWVELGEVTAESAQAKKVAIRFAIGQTAPLSDSGNMNGNTSLTWSIDLLSAQTPIGSNYSFHNTPVATVSAGGVVVQLHTGVLEITINNVDWANQNGFVSLGWGPKDCFELNNFRQGTIYPLNADTDSLVVRRSIKNNNQETGAEITYCNLAAYWRNYYSNFGRYGGPSTPQTIGETDLSLSQVAGATCLVAGLGPVDKNQLMAMTGVPFVFVGNEIGQVWAFRLDALSSPGPRISVYSNDNTKTIGQILAGTPYTEYVLQTVKVLTNVSLDGNGNLTKTFKNVAGFFNVSNPNA